MGEAGRRRWRDAALLLPANRLRLVEHGDAVRDISRGFGPFEARLAKEPKVIHEQIHRHHKLQLKGNNLWGESSFDSV